MVRLYVSKEEEALGSPKRARKNHTVGHVLQCGKFLCFDRSPAIFLISARGWVPSLILLLQDNTKHR